MQIGRDLARVLGPARVLWVGCDMCALVGSLNAPVASTFDLDPDVA